MHYRGIAYLGRQPTMRSLSVGQIFDSRRLSVVKSPVKDTHIYREPVKVRFFPLHWGKQAFAGLNNMFLFYSVGFGLTPSTLRLSKTISSESLVFQMLVKTTLRYLSVASTWNIKTKEMHQCDASPCCRLRYVF